MFQDDQALLLDMQIAAEQALSHAEGVDWAAFDSSALIQDAVSRQVQVIGEAASRVSPAFRDSHPAIPWHRIGGMRHRLVHDYRSIRRDVLWDAVQKWIPQLLGSLAPLIPAEPPEEG